MFPYWLMYIFPVVVALQGFRLTTTPQRAVWLCVIIVFTFLIGFRHEVGGDWSNYIRNYNLVSFMEFKTVIGQGDSAYYALNWCMSALNLSVHWSNFLCAAILMYGVHVFSRSQPRPWLALGVAVPYLLIVLAMGYTRQATALGLILVGLVALGRGQGKQFVVWVLAAALFHKSAVLLLPIAALAATRSRLWSCIWVGMTTILMAYFILYDSADRMWQSYVVSGAIQSEGAMIRVSMNAVPATFLLIFRKELFYSDEERRLWCWLSIFALMMVPLVPFASTAVDRMALYLIPLQLFTFSRIQFLVKPGFWQQVLIFGVIVYYALVQLVWLNFANHASGWLPYRNLLFV